VKRSSTQCLKHERPVTHHQVILALLKAGLSLAEARSLGMEEVLCLLAHRRLEETLAALDAEAARVAGLPLAEAGEQQRLLAALHHRAEAALDRFYRRRQGETHATTP
jgi:hypothetical protein